MGYKKVNHRSFLTLTTGLMLIGLSCFSFQVWAENTVQLVCDITHLRTGNTHSIVYTIDYDTSKVVEDFGDGTLQRYTPKGVISDNDFIYHSKITNDLIILASKIQNHDYDIDRKTISRITGEYRSGKSEEWQDMQERAGHKRTGVTSTGQCHKSEGAKF